MDLLHFLLIGGVLWWVGDSLVLFVSMLKD